MSEFDANRALIPLQPFQRVAFADTLRAIAVQAYKANTHPGSDPYNSFLSWPVNKESRV